MLLSMLISFIDWLLLALLLTLALALLYLMLNSANNFIFISLNSQVLYPQLDQIQILITIEFLCQDLELVPDLISHIIQ
ncbi:predicted protein [Histoplasma mississippiense (nom. inval.)]|uniref:predicted protein n=1 Tax=Ajellomyces capsulatus (strain NAm1 / WU24) TaxID=2059318 RepID=UPI000157B631|nr:predicted protein [Histoplasma mississippiense (nom. inval.)]EDN02450.1 predicted protein [Histoplasma mississippiense (nom. inval.)]